MPMLVPLLANGGTKRKIEARVKSEKLNYVYYYYYYYCIFLLLSFAQVPP